MPRDFKGYGKSDGRLALELISVEVAGGAFD